MPDYFRSSRLVYRAIDNPSDNEFYHSIHLDSDAFANTNAGLLRPFTRKESEQRQMNSDKALLGVLICLLAPPIDDTDNKAYLLPQSKPIPIGRMFLSGSSPANAHHRNSTIGIDIIAQYQGQGYGSEAIKWVLNWGFRMAGLHRVSIECFSYNHGALRLYEKLGFILEGRKRESIWFDGAWHDTILLSMLEHEWRA